MNILYILDSPYAFRGGCWFYRNHLPAEELRKRGHDVAFISLGSNVPEKWMSWPGTVVFSRYYPRDPLILMREYKRLGKRVVYEVDDDLWTVNPDNPSAGVTEVRQRQYECLMKEVDAITTTTEILAKKLRKFNKNVFVCPNAIDYSLLGSRLEDNEILRIGYSGAASHWGDLKIITDALIELRKKHEFQFAIQGMTGSPLESEMFIYERLMTQGLKPEKNLYFKTALEWFTSLKGLDWFHVPFYPPEMFPAITRKCNFDIGIAPLQDNKFNHSKSCIKFYEYAAAGAVTLASDVLPYKNEVGYTAKQNTKDWVKKLERLIVDKKFKAKLLKKQMDWVKENRDLSKIVLKWEQAFDKK